MPLTVIIPCKDEEKNIGYCIKSIASIADEILVADSGSTDKTMEIARQYKARIIEREYIYSADFKNWAIPQATHQWILLLDADERATPELIREVQDVLMHTPEYQGYYIFRKNFLFGHPVKRFLLYTIHGGLSSRCFSSCHNVPRCSVRPSHAQPTFT